jgi:aminoglycoside phosphotransferase (APT) family kinase protein
MPSDSTIDPDLARHLPLDRFGAIREVTTIETGLSGASVYAVTTDAGAYVLRRVKVADEAKWKQELAVHTLASENGIAPPLEHVDESGPATVSARIAAAPPGAAFGNPEVRPRVMASLIEMLTKLHALPLNGIARGDPLAEARKIWRRQTARTGFPAWALLLGDHLDRCESILALDPRLVLSHNDANPGNILWDGERVWLVDWSASGATHPYYDLAAIAMFIRLDDDLALALLARQEGHEITGEQAETFRALRQLSNIFCGAMFLSLASELTTLVPTRLEDALTMPQLYARIGSGALVLRSDSGQVAFGTALLREAVERGASAS